MTLFLVALFCSCLIYHQYKCSLGLVYASAIWPPWWLLCLRWLHLRAALSWLYSLKWWLPTYHWAMFLRGLISSRESLLATAVIEKRKKKYFIVIITKTFDLFRSHLTFPETNTFLTNNFVNRFATPAPHSVNKYTTWHIVTPLMIPCHDNHNHTTIPHAFMMRIAHR